MYTFKLSDSRFVFSLMNQMAGSMYVVSTATANSTTDHMGLGLRTSLPHLKPGIAVESAPNKKRNNT